MFVERWQGARPEPVVVFLHHGIGSVSQWRDFPRRLCEAVGLPGLAYDRAGHGKSQPRTAPIAPDYLHQEARALEALLEQERVRRPILVGHSDGGSIALLCRTPVRALIINGGIGATILQYRKYIHDYHKDNTEYAIVENTMRHRNRRLKHRTKIFLKKEKNKYRRQHQYNI